MGHLVIRINAMRGAPLLVAALVVLAPGRALASTHGAAEESAAAVPAATADEVRGIALGEFRIRSDYPAEAQKSTVRFTLFAAIRGDRLAAMQRLVKDHQNKIRDEVITATRLTPLNVFEEPDLRTFRRHVFVRLQRALPELIIEELYISNFGLMVKTL